MKESFKRVISQVLCVVMLTFAFFNTALIKEVNAATTFWMFNYTGNVQTFSVPYSGTYYVKVVGAAGGNDGYTDTSYGGKGGSTEGYIDLKAGTAIYIYAGGRGLDNVTGTGAGFNGGGNAGVAGKSGAGGGATDIRVGGNSLSNRVIVAGGGGGAGHDNGHGSNGGNGGNSDTNGQHSMTNGATSYSGGTSQYGNGTLGQGANSSADGGGGGGGYYGGGAGVYNINNDNGAGGGSSYIGGVSNGLIASGVNSGNGYATLNFMDEVIVAPTAPSNLTYNVSNNAVILTWAAVNGATDYYVYRNNTKIATVTGNSYTDSSVKDGTTNTYYVMAHNSQGTSGASNTVTVKTLAAPTAPSNLTYNVSNNAVILTWAAVNGATDYYVYRNNTKIATVAGNSYTDSSVKDGTTNTYYVIAHNSQGTSGASSSVTVTTQAVPKAPSNLAYSLENDQLHLTWALANGATDYYVYKNNTQIATVTENSYVDYSVKDGTTNTYYVKAHNSKGISGASNTVTVKTLAAPTAPSNLTYNVSNNAVILTWASVNGATDYYVYKNSAQIATVTENGYIDYAATSNGAANAYYVKAHNSVGLSEASNTVTVSTQSAPAAPSNLAYSVANNTIRLTWTAVNGATDYYVYKNNTQIATVTENSYVDSSVTTSGTANTYYVKAHNSVGLSGASNVVAVILNTTVTQPTVVPNTGSYTQPLNVYLYTDSDATIRYTTDGSEPTENSTIFTNSIYVDKTTVIKAKAFANGSASSTAVAAYTIQSSSDDKDALLSKAKGQYNSGDYDGAIGTLNQLLALDKDNEDGILLYADCYVKKNDLDSAKNKLQEFIYVYEYPRVVNRYAQLCIKKGQYEEARQKLVGILPKYPGESYLYQTLADAYEKLNITGIRVFAFGNEVDFSNYDNIRPYLSEGRTLIPIRALAEALGAQVDWNVALQKATIYYNGKTLEITNGQRYAKVNGSATPLDVVAQMKGERLMVPLRFVSENFDKLVDWYSVESVVNIISITNQE